MFLELVSIYRQVSEAEQVQRYFQQPDQNQSPRESSYSDFIELKQINLDWNNLVNDAQQKKISIYDHLLDVLTQDLYRFDEHSRKYYSDQIVNIEYSGLNELDPLRGLPTDNEALQHLKNDNEAVYKIRVESINHVQKYFTTLEQWLQQKNIKFEKSDNHGQWTLQIYFGSINHINVEIIAVRNGVFEMVLHNKNMFELTHIYAWEERSSQRGRDTTLVNYLRLCSEEQVKNVLEHIWDAYKTQIKLWQPDDDLQDGNGNLFMYRPRAPLNNSKRRDPALDETLQRQWYENLKIGSWDDRKNLIHEWNTGNFIYDPDYAMRHKCIHDIMYTLNARINHLERLNH